MAKNWCILMIIIFLLLSACTNESNVAAADNQTANPNKLPKTTPTTSPAATILTTPTIPNFASALAPMGTGLVPDKEKTIFVSGDLADCYLAILHQLYGDDSDQRVHPKLIFFNDSGMKCLDISERCKLLEGVKKYGAIVMMMDDDFDERKSKGKVMNLLIREKKGFVFILADKPMSNGVMSVRAGAWHAPLAAYGLTMDITQVDDGWEIGPIRDDWIS